MTTEETDEFDAWVPNATTFEVARMFLGDDREPTWIVSWENTWGFEADPDEPDDDGTPEEGEEKFPSLEAAFDFCRQLVAAADAASKVTGTTQL